MVMKRAEFNTRHSGYYFGCNFLLKALKRSAFVINSSIPISREIFSAILFVLPASGYRQKDAASYDPLFCLYFIAPSNFATKSSLPLSMIYDSEFDTNNVNRQSTLEAVIIFKRIKNRLGINND